MSETHEHDHDHEHGTEEGFGLALGFRIFEVDGELYMAEAEISSYVDDPNALGATLVFHALSALDPTSPPDEDDEDLGWRIDIDDELTRDETGPAREQFQAILRQLAGLGEVELRQYLEAARQEQDDDE
ncbi:MAG TPA: hypothetical protein VF665_17080 [Longimicrobium sp.]|jgi:hypothetical protein|uniref:hypothetical protein n=1 Tax=Longimicrobium sp. TaxID=2029185 RepID=UPI002ED84742